MKKILSIMITMMIICNVFFCLNIKSYAAEENVIEVSTIGQFREAMTNAPEGIINGKPTRIKLLNDISNRASFTVYNKYISIDLNNYTLTCGFFIGTSLTSGKLDIYNGTLKSYDVDEEYASPAAKLGEKGELEAKNVSFIGGSATAKYVYGGFGIKSLGNVNIESCIVRSGNSSEEKYAQCAFYGDGGTGIIKDCIFIRGEGIVHNYYPTIKVISNGDYKDNNGNPIYSSAQDVNSVTIGNPPLIPLDPSTQIPIEKEDIEVKGTYIDPTGEIIYSVNVSWGSMEFEYKEGNKGTWNPQSHTYTGATASTWNYNGNNNISVTNHSNADIKVKLLGTPEEDKFKGDSSFVFYSDEALSSIITDKKTISSAVDKPTDDDSLIYKAFLKINGEMNTSDSLTSIGNITVQIGN